MKYIHNQFTKKYIWAILGVGLLFIAASSYGASPGDFEDPTTSENFATILTGIANFVIRVGIPVLTFFIVWTGVKFVLAQGNEEKLTEARTMLYWVLLGGAIVMGAGVLAQIVINFALTL